ncbi:MAG TPA: bifunctional oligoribonuclease/PAP phosphatase NrnA [Terriglobales bacterium]|nr:bifunctional oligoribonuclease/PAP phosphatase NrnA [Terriglobales bacterium]
MLQKILKEIGQRQRFLLTTHARPDGDAIGSALACSQILRLMGKEAEVVLREGVPRIYQRLPFADTVVTAERVNGKYEAAILLECDSIQRTRLEGLESGFLINIDHHVSGRPFAHVNWIDPNAVATAEMIYKLAREAGVKISPQIASCIYTAVIADTGSFMFEGTNEHTFALARELVLAGANPVHCARSIYFGHSTAKMRLLGAALSNLHREGHLAWIWVTREQMERVGAKEEDCEGLVNYALSIHDVEVAIFFRELPDGRIRASLRSKGQVNVSTVAEQFGGGGHKCASGCSVEGPLSIAVAHVVDQLRARSSVQ